MGKDIYFCGGQKTEDSGQLLVVSEQKTVSNH